MNVNEYRVRPVAQTPEERCKNILRESFKNLAAVRLSALADRHRVTEEDLIEAAYAVGAAVSLRGGEKWAISSRSRRDHR